MINTSKDALGAAGTWAKEKAGDLLDYVGKPGKLVDKVLKEFGVDFSMVNGEIPKMLWNAMWKRLKEGVKSLFSGWLDDASEGDMMVDILNILITSLLDIVLMVHHLVIRLTGRTLVLTYLIFTKSTNAFRR